MNPVTFLEPVSLQGCSSFPIPLQEGVVQFRGDGSATAHQDSCSYNLIPSRGLPWLLGATGYLALCVRASFLAGSASLVVSWFWLLPALSLLRLRIAVLTLSVDSFAITAPDWDSVNMLIYFPFYFLIMENRSACRISHSRLFTCLLSIPQEVAHSNSWEIVLS